MAITRTATPTASAPIAAAGAVSFGHNCAATTSLLLLVIQADAENTITGTPTWNTSENFTLIRDTGTGTASGDVRQLIYGIVNPTAGNFNVAFTVAGSIGPDAIAFAVSYLGTETSSVAAAAIYLDEQINNAAATTVAMNEAVGGTAGRTAFAAATFFGGDGDPASETASGGQFASPMFNSATGTSTLSDRSYWVADQISWTPAAVTVDWTSTASDECVGTIIELVPAPGPSTVVLDTGAVAVAGADVVPALPAPPPCSSEQVLVHDLTDVIDLYVLEPDTVDATRSPKSLVKLMTATLAIERKAGVLDSQTVTITSADLTTGTLADLQNGDVLTWRHLLYGLMVPSGNDAALAIGRVIGTEIFNETGTGNTGVTRFVEAMNSKATALGMTNTTFTSVNGGGGIDTDRTTPRDVVTIAAEAWGSSDLRTISNTATHQMVITGANARTYDVTHTSPHVGDTGVLASKTGSGMTPTISNLALLWEAPNGNEIAICTMFAAGSGGNRTLDIKGILYQILEDYPYLVTGAPIPGDSNFDDVVLLAGADTGFVDESSFGRTLTPGSGATRSTTNPLFGTHSFAFDGTTNGHIAAADAAELSFGSGDFTVECYFAGNGSEPTGTHCALVSKYNTSSQREWSIQYDIAGDLFAAFVSTDGTAFNSTTYGFASRGITPSVFFNGATRHILIRRSGTEFALYVNGEKSTTPLDLGATALHAGTARAVIGARDTGASVEFPFPGKIDEVRVTAGVARQTAVKFTPTGRPYARSSGELTALDTGAVAVAGADLLAAQLVALDIDDVAVAGNDLTIPETITLTLDTAAIAVAGADVLAHLNATLDIGASTVAGSDVVNLPTALAAVNTSVTLEVDTTYLVRVRVENTGLVGGTSFRWTDSHQGGAHTPITTSSSVVKAVAASSFANDADVPEAIGGSGTYVSNNDAATEDGTTTLPAGFPAGGAIEFVLAFQIVGADVSDEDAILLRLELGDGTDFAIYTNTPTITVNKIVGAIVLDTAAIAVAGDDAAANVQPTLDTGTIAAVGNDLAANPTITLDTDDVAVAGADLSAAQSITLDIDDIAVAGADLIILEDKTLVLDIGSISLVSTDIVILADTALVLDIGAVAAAGTELVPLQQWAVLPDSVFATSNLRDTDLVSPPVNLSDLVDDPNSPDGDWWTAIDHANDTEARFGFASPSGGAISGEQTIQLLLRKSGAANVTANVELWVAGVFDATLATGVSITSGTGQIVEVNFDGTGRNKADIEIRVVGLAA